MNKRNPIVYLCIDGLGMSASWHGNAILSAKMDTLTEFRRQYPRYALSTGRKNGAVIDSSILNYYSSISRGKIVPSNREILDQEIKTKKIYKNKKIIEIVNKTKASNASLNLVAHLPSVLNPYSDMHHLLAIVNIAKNAKLLNTNIHLIIDSDHIDSSHAAIKNLEKELSLLNYGKIASITGANSILQSRPKNIATTVNYLTSRKGKFAITPYQAILSFHKKGLSLTDLPTVKIVENKYPVGIISDFDSVIGCDFNANAIAPLLESLRSNGPKFIKVVSLIQNDLIDQEGETILTQGFFESLPHILAKHKISQVYITDNKRATILNNSFSDVYQSEFIKKSFVSNVDNDGAKNDKEIIKELFNKTAHYISKFDFTMLSLSTVYERAKKNSFDKVLDDLNIVDQGIEHLSKIVAKHNGTLVISGSFGFLEKMAYKSKIDIANNYSGNPVPLMIIGEQFKGLTQLKSKSTLAHHNFYDILNRKSSIADIAPTILDLFELATPDSMNGRSVLSLLEKEGKE